MLKKNFLRLDCISANYAFPVFCNVSFLSRNLFAKI